jgi:hypothetical protein
MYTRRLGWGKLKRCKVGYKFVGMYAIETVKRTFEIKYREHDK